MYPTAGAPRLRFVLVAALTMAVVTGCSRSPADGSADAGFARDMATHHAPAMPGSPRMIGMASETELDALRHAEGHDAEVLFLQLMIRHHEGGVLMAQDVLEQSHRNEVVTLARSVASGQTGEIKAMTTMLRDRGAEPLPTLLK